MICARTQPVPDHPAIARLDLVESGGRHYTRYLFTTRWLHADNELPVVLAETVADHVRTGDTVFVAEKVAILLTGRSVHASSVRVGRLARTLAGRVRPIGTSRGLSIPEKMQYVVDHVGAPRILLAVGAAALTRPLGISGAFYRIAGHFARDLDGMRSPYVDTLLPPLPPADAHQLACGLAAAIGHPVAIVDINDRGGSIRAVSPGGTTPATLLAVLADNPLGHSQQATPIGLLWPR